MINLGIRKLRQKKFNGCKKCEYPHPHSQQDLEYFRRECGEDATCWVDFAAIEIRKEIDCQILEALLKAIEM